jgi:hypothetical protein
MVEHFYTQFPGFFDFEDLYRRAVKKFVRTGANVIFYELGVFHGRSFSFLAVEMKNAQELVSDCGVMLCGVDTFDWPEEGITSGTEVKLCRELRRRGLERVAYTICEDSAVAAHDIRDNSVDFVFIDASHDYESVMADITAWLPKVRRGGVLAGHDYLLPNFPGVIRAVDEVLGTVRVDHMRTSWWWEKP